MRTNLITDPQAKAIADKVAKAIYDALTDSTWRDRHEQAYQDLGEYLGDISITIATTIQEYKDE